MVGIEVQRLCLQSRARKLNERLHGNAIAWLKDATRDKLRFFLFYVAINITSEILGRECLAVPGVGSKTLDGEGEPIPWVQVSWYSFSATRIIEPRDVVISGHY